MKKIIIIISALLLLVSCGKSEEERFNEMVANATKSNLFFPESYDPVSTSCDSLTTTIISDVNIKKVAKIIELTNEAANHQREMERNIEMQDYWRGKYSTFYNKYTDKAKKAETKYNKALSQAKELLNQLLTDYRNDDGFQGYIVDHRFRAKNNAGNVLVGDCIFIVDKEKKNITAGYDAESEDFLSFYQMIGQLRDLQEDVTVEDIDLFELCDNIKSKFELQYSSR